MVLAPKPNFNLTSSPLLILFSPLTLLRILHTAPLSAVSSYRCLQYRSDSFSLFLIAANMFYSHEGKPESSQMRPDARIDTHHSSYLTQVWRGNCMVCFHISLGPSTTHQPLTRPRTNLQMQARRHARLQVLTQENFAQSHLRRGCSEGL